MYTEFEEFNEYDFEQVIQSSEIWLVRSESEERSVKAITTTSQKLLYRPDANFGILVYGSALKINLL